MNRFFLLFFHFVFSEPREYAEGHIAGSTASHVKNGLVFISHFHGKTSFRLCLDAITAIVFRHFNSTCNEWSIGRVNGRLFTVHAKKCTCGIVPVQQLQPQKTGLFLHKFNKIFSYQHIALCILL